MHPIYYLTWKRKGTKARAALSKSIYLDVLSSTEKVAKEEVRVCMWDWRRLTVFHIHLPEGSSTRKQSYPIQLLSVYSPYTIVHLICSPFEASSKEQAKQRNFGLGSLAQIEM